MMGSPHAVSIRSSPSLLSNYDAKRRYWPDRYSSHCHSSGVYPAVAVEKAIYESSRDKGRDTNVGAIVASKSYKNVKNIPWFYKTVFYYFVTTYK